MQVALLGGSFNPPHVGHLMAASYVHATQGVDQVWLMPSWQHPFGKQMEDFDHRIAMCEAMCRETSGWLRTTRIESEPGLTGRTVDTLELLVARHPDVRWSIIIGSDILRDLPHWKDFHRIEAMSRVLVLYRAGYPAPNTVGPPLAEVSSTEIRELLARGKEPSDLVPSGVLAHARAAGLYGLGRAR
ncbi:nicotinate (nicotinamide) nucleotide adenylyltransferase [Myxococcus sp. MISCRS1]|uniref:Probable nicotinate-nucleotide adenylyltransferase n=2 Tax=Myxococcus TaxID=32 RepID=A0A511T6Z2_MYXFU|nr:MULTISPECIES: nicotinate (nicotinamide) nucleotide adenylyltransferase [Myxococcus]AKF81389.1 nicotinate-nucleotide adenylyltransferase [Myxococcus fulvus 124B02]BDT34258.1 nicotinate (nicotinamide) nucleotide adenylyltransferase [Myxococcus sp. MH1]MCY0995762.1 nicotinate (nicotinamide) nucleotide adenylyltransferase [Myxococcus sp. MISCRS1]SEU25826.1 nicotinate-nucleotide adenylyltransferase [Myxococcus fulvus]GEN09929.1 putative nicotinate-nucleotide adenylyltransferase [Myxococcus fulvu